MLPHSEYSLRYGIFLILAVDPKVGDLWYNQTPKSKAKDPHRY